MTPHACPYSSRPWAAGGPAQRILPVLRSVGVGHGWQGQESLGWGDSFAWSPPPGGWSGLVLHGRCSVPRQQAEPVRFNVTSAEATYYYNAEPRLTLLSVNLLLFLRYVIH